MSRSRAVIDEGTSGEMRHISRNEMYVGGGKSVLSVVNGETSGSGADPDANGEICGSWTVVDVKTTARMRKRNSEPVIVNGETSGGGRPVAGVFNRWQRYGEMSDSVTCTAVGGSPSMSQEYRMDGEGHCLAVRLILHFKLPGNGASLLCPYEVLCRIKCSVKSF